MKVSYHHVAALLAVVLPVAWTQAAPKRPAQPGPEDLAKITAALPDKPYAQPTRPRKVLVVSLCKGFYHRSIPWGKAALRLLGEKTGAWTAQFSDDMEAFRADNLKQFDTVILNNTTKLPFKDRPDLKKALMDFVTSGHGLVGIHAATDNFYDWPEGAAMIGGLFAGHPWRANETVVLRVEEPSHPLVRMFQGKPFKVTDEIYQFKSPPYDRSKLRVLLSLDFANGTVKKGNRTDGDYAVSWIRRYGQGRVFYCSLGHNNAIYWNPTVLRHYLAGIQYALGDLQVPDQPR